MFTQSAPLASNRIDLKPGKIIKTKSIDDVIASRPNFHRLFDIFDKTEANQPKNQDFIPFSKPRNIFRTKLTDDNAINALSPKLHRLFEKTDENYQNKDLIPFSNLKTNLLTNKANNILNRNKLIDHRSNIKPSLNSKIKDILNRNHYVEDTNLMSLSKLKRSNILNRNNYNERRNISPLSARRNNYFNRNVGHRKKYPLSNLRRNDIHNRNKYFNPRDFMPISNSRRNYMKNRNNDYSLNPSSSLQNMLEHWKELARSKVMTLKRDIGGLKKINRIFEILRNRREINNGIFDEPKGLFGSPSNLNEVMVPSGVHNKPHFIRKLSGIIRKFINVLLNIFQAQSGSKSGHSPFNLRRN